MSNENIKIDDLDALFLGISGENISRTISIDARAWYEEFPQGHILASVRRAGQTETYLAPITENIEAGLVYWSPTAYDTQYAGNGEAEFRLVSGDIVKKSVVAMTTVSPSMQGTGTVTPQEQTWIDRIEAAAAEIAENIDTYEQIREDVAADAQSASESADAAAEAESSAISAKESAEQSAQTAQGVVASVNAAKNAAEQARDDAGDYSLSASQSATGAAESATTAANKASEADGHADRAYSYLVQIENAMEAAGGIPHYAKLSYDHSTHNLSVELLDINEAPITSDAVQLPFGYMISRGVYNEETDCIDLYRFNNVVTSIDISALLSSSQSAKPDETHELVLHSNNLWQINPFYLSRVGYTIGLTMNPTTYVLTLTMYNGDGNAVSTQSVDLPIESLVMSVEYDEDEQEIIITLQSGDVTRIPLSGLVAGLINEKPDGTNYLIVNGKINSVYLPTVSTAYNDLTGKPKLNGIEINGNKTSEDYGLTTSVVASSLDSDGSPDITTNDIDVLYAAAKAGQTAQITYNSTALYRVIYANIAPSYFPEIIIATTDGRAFYYTYDYDPYAGQNIITKQVRGGVAPYIIEYFSTRTVSGYSVPDISSGTVGYLVETTEAGRLTILKGYSNGESYIVHSCKNTSGEKSVSIQIGGIIAVYSASGSVTVTDFTSAEKVKYLTTAPTSNNPTANTLIPVYLQSEPQTKYSGYIYFISE